MNSKISQNNPSIISDAKVIFEKITEEVFKDGDLWHTPKTSKLESFQELKEGNEALKIEVMKLAVEAFAIESTNRNNYQTLWMCKDLLTQLWRSNDIIPIEDLEWMVNKVLEIKGIKFRSFPIKPFIRKIEKLQASEGLTDNFVNTLLKTKRTLENSMGYMIADHHLYNSKIKKIYDDHFGDGKNILADDELGKVVNDFLYRLPDPEFPKWKSLCSIFMKLKSGSKVTKNWKTLAKGEIDKVGKITAAQVFPVWINHATELYKQGHRNQNSQILTPLNQVFLKNLVLASSFFDEAAVINSVDELGLVCLKKLRGVGQISKKIGNACILSFSLMPFELGIEKLTKYRSKVKYPSTKKIIENRILDVAKREGKTPEEVEEMGVPSMGFDDQQKIEIPMKEFTAVLEIESLQKTNLYWRKLDGKTQKTPPSAIKDDFKEEIKSLKKKAKDVKTLLLSNRYRIERFFLLEREWIFKDWFKYYIEHFLMGFLGKRIIWHFAKDDQHTTAIFHKGKWFNPHGENLDWIDEETKIRLWHPINATVDYISTWRDWLTEQEIQQPFKQAFREIYIVTEAELNTKSYSNRFAAHVLRQFQFTALCQLRGWKYGLQGAWDSHNTPVINLPNWDIRAEFWVDADSNGGTSPSMIYTHLFSDQVRFYLGGQQLDMDEVPALVFSEIMRDVDMFVGVTSIGNDPEWQDNGANGYRTYWESYTQQDLTQTSKTRKAVLEKLIPRLKIANQCSFTDKNLVVKGKIRTYKIHLGSGNILMEPNDQYLCIVAGRSNSASKIFLPFEGDQLLSIILSKAFMLAEDDKIKDRTITSQINFR